MGRFSAGGVRLHELRQPKPANATFRQGQPPQSHSFSLGLGQPQRAIRASCREKPTLGVIARPRDPSTAGAGAASAGPGPHEAAKGSAPRLLPLGTPPATCPLKRRGAVAKAEDPRRQIAAIMPHARGRTCPKGLENSLGTGSCADASAPSAIAAPEAPQERSRRCTRTSRRRRRSGWTG